jgi:cytochrome d ubiquinol oxidase subunit I
VLSPLMAYEGLMAFFLEASFLGVLLFGRRLVPTWAHFLRRRHGRRRHLG